MATVKALVLSASKKVQEIQSGDNLDQQADQHSTTFTSLVIAGAPVYSDGAASVENAQANVDGTSRVVGLAATGVAALATGDFIFDGVISLTTGEWDTVAGTTGGLTENLCYFLSDATAGRILEEGAVVGLTGGDNVVLLGTGLSATEMLINIQPPIKTAA